MGSDLSANRSSCRVAGFQSTLPGWGATQIALEVAAVAVISIHAPRMGSDCVKSATQTTKRLFQSTLPGWGATRSLSRSSCRTLHFNPRSPDGERPIRGTVCLSTAGFQSTLPGWGATPIYDENHRAELFQSTLPGWGATGCPACIGVCLYFNPRSPDGERLSKSFAPPNVSRISIHAPRMGSDPLHIDIIAFDARLFQSTLPGWGATLLLSPNKACHVISIHAPRMGSDCRSRSARCIASRISIHAPRMGSDPPGGTSCPRNRNFNPRSPDGERLGGGAHVVQRLAISIHAPRMGSDRNTWARIISANDFNPRSPDGERRYDAMYHPTQWNFNPRSPDGERLMLFTHPPMNAVFQSTLPGWGATSRKLPVYAPFLFQSTLPGWGATLL